MRHIFGLFLITLMLTGCFGGKRAPDETRVVSGPQLILPPQYGLVPPQKGGLATPAERAADDQVNAAQEALLGGAIPQAATTTEEANWLLGDQQVDPSIREKLVVDEAVAEETEANKSFMDKLLGDR